MRAVARACWRGRSPLFATRRVVEGALSRRLSSAGTTTTPPNVFLTEEEVSIREAAAVFAAGEVAPRVLASDKAGAMDPALIAALFEAGFFGVEIEERYGGSGASFTSALLVIEELARVDPAVSVMVDIHNTIVNNCLAKWGSEALRDEWLPKLATEALGAFALSEAGAGSDAFALETEARREGDEYLLRGSKLWISNSAEAGVFLVMANVDRAGLGHRGITCFVVPRGAPGLAVGPREDKLGIRASSTCPLYLDGVRVPASSIVGQVGHGYKYAMEILNEGRIGIAAQMVGLAQGGLDKTLPYLGERRQFDQALWDFQGVQHQVAQLATDLEAARVLTYHAARTKEAGGDVAKLASMAKLLAAQASKCVELMGGVGFTRDAGVEKLYRDAKIGAIYEGTSNIQLNTIAKIIASDLKRNRRPGGS